MIISDAWRRRALWSITVCHCGLPSDWCTMYYCHTIMKWGDRMWWVTISNSLCILYSVCPMMIAIYGSNLLSNGDTYFARQSEHSCIDTMFSNGHAILCALTEMLLCSFRSLEIGIPRNWGFRIDCTWADNGFSGFCIDTYVAITGWSHRFHFVSSWSSPLFWKC